MRSVSEMEVRQTRIYPVDSLPFVRLITPTVNKAFRDRFGWGGIESLVEGEIVFRPGHLAPAGKEAPTPIKALQINQRRMILTVLGDSAATTRVHKEIVGFLSEHLGWKPIEPVVTTEDTTCVVSLDFDWTALLAPAMRSLVAETLPGELSSVAAAKAEIRGLTFGLHVVYTDVPPSLRDHGVTLSEKLFTVEPRLNAPLSERRYYTFSPTDSETHIGILKKLERALSQDVQGAKRHSRTSR